MTDSQPPHVVAIYRYPLKAFSPERLARVTVTPGATLPCDRAYAVEVVPGKFDGNAPRHLPKITFLTLMRDERCAALDTHFDDASHTLTIRKDGAEVVRADLGTDHGRRAVERFLAAHLEGVLRGPPKVVSAPGHSFSDVKDKCLHVVNLASLRELERVAGRNMNPLRFRPNVILDGLAPWQEFEWIGQHFRLGAAGLEGFDRTVRCAATNVDPKSAERDIDLPAQLLAHFGHSDFGIYATVLSGGEIAEGDPVA
jgi:hypothetical protein